MNMEFLSKTIITHMYTLFDIFFMATRLLIINRHESINKISKNKHNPSSLTFKSQYVHAFSNTTSNLTTIL